MVDGKGLPDLIAAAFGLVAPLLFIRGLAAPFWSARFAALLILGTVGLISLLSLVRTRLRVLVIASVMFGGWATVSTLLSPAPMMAVVGKFGLGSGLLFIWGLVGAWALGAAVSSGGRALLERTLMIAVVVNASMSLIEASHDLSWLGLGLFKGRPVGLWGNPVFNAAFLAAGVWVILARIQSQPRTTLFLLAIVTAAIELTGTRAALLLLALGTILGVRRVPFRLIALAGASLVLGLVVGASIGAFGVVSSSQTATGRLQAQPDFGYQARFDTWRSAGQAIARRPLVGAGPGRFGAATSSVRTLRTARLEGADSVFFDAHNLIVEYAVTTGIVGVALLGAWLTLAIRRADRGAPLLGFAVFLLIAHLFEPQDAGLTPIAFLALGAAASTDVTRASLPLRALTAAFTVVITAIAAAGLFGARALQTASTDDTLRHAAAARQFLPGWPDAMEATALVETRMGLEARGQRRSEQFGIALMWDRRALARDPYDEEVCLAIGDDELRLGDLQAAAAAYHCALKLNPWSTAVADDLALTALRSSDTAEAVQWLHRAELVDPQQAGVCQALLTRFQDQGRANAEC